MYQVNTCNALKTKHTQDLHDGAGLSDATATTAFPGVNGQLSNPIFENIDYDLLTIGNHELYISAIAYETFKNFSTVYGEKYLTSNVQIANPSTGAYEYIGKTHRYFTTKKGLSLNNNPRLESTDVFAKAFVSWPMASFSTSLAILMLQRLFQPQPW